jgi:tetratricopeptide (TPR) repeat protein
LVTDHLTPEELDNFLRGKLILSRKRDVFLHLARGCPECRGVAGRGFYFGSPTATAPEEILYESVIKSAIAEALRLDQVRKRAEEKERAAALLATGNGLQGIVDKGDMPLRGLGILEAIQDRMAAVRHDSPKELVELARGALGVALDLDPAEYGANKVSDHQARAWAELGNALRVAEEYREAGRAFGNAFHALRKGTGNQLLKARLHELHASLLGALRTLDYALDAVEFVYSVYMEAGELHLAGRLLLKKSIFIFYQGRPEEALKINQKGRIMLDPQREPGLLVTALQNDLLFLEGCGRFSEAKNLLFKNRDLLNRTGKITRLKLRWAEARIELAMDNLISAEQAFSEVREGMIAASLGFNASLASLELALVWMRQGRAEDAEEIVYKAAETFYSLGFHLEVLAAVQLLVDAFQFKKASVLLMQRTVSFIREWEINPDTRFLPSEE